MVEELYKLSVLIGKRIQFISSFLENLQEWRDSDQHQDQWENPATMAPQQISVNPIPIFHTPLTLSMGKNLLEWYFLSGFFFFSFQLSYESSLLQFRYSGYPQELYAMVSVILLPSFQC